MQNLTKLVGFDYTHEKITKLKMENSRKNNWKIKRKLNFILT